MFAEALKQMKIGIILLIVMSVLTGILYPLVVTGIGQVFFPWKANGSLMKKDGKILGSVLIGQSFTTKNYFWGRPSATTPYPYNAESSSGSNYAPTNDYFLNIIKDRIITLRNADFTNDMAVPVDMVTGSASGLDPEISPLAALYQTHRVAIARGLSQDVVQRLVERFTIRRCLGLLGEQRVNVLQLNLALDELQASPTAKD
jgi:K+-transporting ATPase ATPase C chain